MLALVYCNFLREVRLGCWGSKGPKGPTLGRTSECVRHNSVRKGKYIVRFEKCILCFDIGISPKRKYMVMFEKCIFCFDIGLSLK